VEAVASSVVRQLATGPALVPVAVVILGGLAASTLLNLFVVPALYLRIAKPGLPRGVAPAVA
jgi:multidrug efflux pump subunit AcrB